MGKAKPKVFSAEKSAKSLRADATKLAKATNVAWSIAKRTPLFLRRPKFVGSGKSKTRAMMTNRHGIDAPIPQRKNRCLRSATIKALLSGAAASVDQLLKAEAGTLKTQIDGELSVAASLPKLSEGAEIELEHALSTYAATIFDRAVRIKNSMKIHSKVSQGAMVAAVDIVNREVFASSTMCPGKIVVDQKRRIVKKKTSSTESVPEPTDEPVAA